MRDVQARSWYGRESSCQPFNTDTSKATFKALNIESDDESDVEVDDTKEIQIEEALKLYQTALKYHSEGPQSYERAAQAYTALFESEIFKYPESQSEIQRLELYGQQPEQDDLYPVEHTGSTVALAPTGENAPSTLPQILHLSYKNHGDFLLEVLQARLRQPQDLGEQPSASDVAIAANAAVDYFVEALDKDDSDLDLWKRTSSLGGILGSQRIARFCLEAILDGDDDTLGGFMSLPGLAEGLAGQQLRELVQKLDDELSLQQPSLALPTRKQLSKMLRQRLEAYSSILTYQDGQRKQLATKLPPAHQRSTLKAPANWAELGALLYKLASNEQSPVGSVGPGDTVFFDIDSVQARDSTDVDGSAPPSVLPTLPSPVSTTLLASIETQSPGLVQDRPPDELPMLENNSGAPNLQDVLPPNTDQAMAEVSLNLPTRKRSNEMAGLEDATESGRSKSKRVRARGSLVGNGSVGDQIPPKAVQQHESELAQFQAIDDWCFGTVGDLLKILHVQDFVLTKDLRLELSMRAADPALESTGISLMDGIALAGSDLYGLLSSFTDCSSRLLLVSGDDLDAKADPSQAGLAGLLANASSSQTGSAQKAMLHTEQGLESFLKDMNTRSLHIREVAFAWLQELLMPGSASLSPPLMSTESSYTSHRWSEVLKTVVVRVIVTLDDFIFRVLQDKLDSLDGRLLKSESGASPLSLLQQGLGFVEMIQTLFELHLDVYSLIKQSNSGVDAETVIAQGYRTERWANLARDGINLRSSTATSPKLNDELNLRHLWSATFLIGISEDVTKEHVIACLGQLRDIFVAVGAPVLELQNNAVMPILAVSSIDREVSRLTTQDFFSKIFDTNQEDPATTVHNLEPLLESIRRHNPAPNEHSSATLESPSESDDSTEEGTSSDRGLHNVGGFSQDIVSFLRNSNISIRLSLWQRLRSAYEALEYPPMVVNCHLRTLELLVEELQSAAHKDQPRAERQDLLLKTLRIVHDVLTRLLNVVKVANDALDCLDNDRIQSSMGSFVSLLRILHASNLFEDELRVGKRQPPLVENGLPLQSFPASCSVLHDVQLQIWVCLYKIFKEALLQNKDLYPAADENRMEFIRSLHRAIGIRGFCSGSNRILLAMIKQELPQLAHVDGYDLEFSQIFFDMYGLKCFVNPAYEQLDHQCQHDAFLDRPAAMQAVDLLLTQSARLKINDLIKHSLKDAIEKVHSVVARKKPSEAINRNKEICRVLLKSPINPILLYRCLHGEGALTQVPVPVEQAVLASKGWYFLMGHISLSKFRSMKRTAPGPTEDLEIAVAFLSQDLEYSSEKWETWFRLAQAYDSKVEENVLWSAEKLNNSPQEVAQYERSAIHCYIMATALATRIEHPDFETSAKVAEMYADFAYRMYASSRLPFAMRAFSLGDAGRFISKYTLSTTKPFKELDAYTAWKFARTLYQRAIAGNPEKWTMHYMLGKCLWKMHNAPHDEARRNIRPTHGHVLAAFVRAIELLPGRKDSKREPILEPHYKLVSVAHKLVMRGALQPREACDILDATQYARKIERCYDLEAWETYILNIVKSLRTADKSNWHHRMIARSAHIIYGDANNDFTTAIGAKHELTQQMFTKAMAIQVWKPEYERPGRHFIYTARYTRFFVTILEQLNDRANLETVGKRMRKRVGEFYEHQEVWSYVCTVYLRTLRRYAHVPVGYETTIFSGINHEEFLQRKDPLEKWCQDAQSKTATLEVMRDAIELKKTNGSLMKPGAIDDLIGDAYAYLYDTVGRQLWSTHMQEQRTVDNIKAVERQHAPLGRNPMMSLNSLMNLDGAPPPLPSEHHVPGPAADTAPPSSQGEQGAPARRKVGVGRREIRMCADACVSRPASAAAQTPAQTESRTPRAQIQVIIPSRKELGLSPVGSLNDDADDESELSELDEDVFNEEDHVQVVKRPMFPGLVRNDLAGSDAGSEGDDEGDDEGEDDGDGRGENDGDEDDGGEDEQEAAHGDVVMFDEVDKSEKTGSVSAQGNGDLAYSTTTLRV